MISAGTMEAFPKPHFITTSQGQLRYWEVGSGPALVVLPGLVLSPCERARRLAGLAPGRRVVAFELPGIGASPSNGEPAREAIARRLAEAVEALGAADPVIVSFDLSNGLAVLLAGALGVAVERTLLVSNPYLLERAADLPVPAHRRANGGHLLDVWTLVRDSNMLAAGKPARVAPQGEELPGPDVLDQTVVAAAADPAAFARLWRTGVEDMAANPGMPPAGLAAALAQAAPPGAVPADAAPRPVPAVPAGQISRDYVDIPSGRVHVRRAGSGRPVMVLQAAPGSAAHLDRVTVGLARDALAIAPDYIGNGESAKARGPVEVATLARDVVDLADALGLADFDIWGSHTGANVAIEISLIAPGRVGRMVLEAPIMLDPALTRDIFENYFHPIVPDRWGTHLIDAWNFRRDLSLFWPWYRQERTAARTVGEPSVELHHEQVLGLLQSGRTYQVSYKAAFSYPTADRMRLIRHPSLICAGAGDVLYETLAKAKGVAPDCCEIVETPATVHYPNQDPAAVEETLLIYRRFLEGRPRGGLTS